MYRLLSDSISVLISSSQVWVRSCLIITHHALARHCGKTALLCLIQPWIDSTDALPQASTIGRNIDAVNALEDYLVRNYSGLNFPQMDGITDHHHPHRGHPLLSCVPPIVSLLPLVILFCGKNYTEKGDSVYMHYITCITVATKQMTCFSF